MLPQRETLAGPVMIPWLNSFLSETAIVGETKIGLSTGEAEHRERRKGGVYIWFCTAEKETTSEVWASCKVNLSGRILYYPFQFLDNH